MLTIHNCSADGWGFLFEQKQQLVDPSIHRPPHFLAGHSASKYQRLRVLESLLKCFLSSLNYSRILP